jgi:hypothetical protein
MLHPACEYSLHLPIVWKTVIHSFSPGLSIDQVMDLWNAGAQYDFGLPNSRSEDYALLVSPAADPSSSSF